jgi:FtsH-binding integral membrane protein
MNLENNSMMENPSDGEGLRSFFSGIYKWMAMGVILSGVFSYLTIQEGSLRFILENQTYFYGIVGIEIAIMLGVQFLIKKLQPKVSLILFFVYAALNGITLSGLFLMYTIDSIASVFAGAIAMFAALAYVGYNTKKDISGWGTFLMVSTWGIFISSIINVFWLQSSVFDTVISGIALLVFGALTVYDNQAYQNIYRSIAGNEEEEKRYTALGALHMYINFIMIFVQLLKFLGNRE